MSPSTQAEFIEYAKAQHPAEACGYLIAQDGRDTLYPCTNTAEDPTQAFTIGAEDFLAASRAGKILAVLHSHPNTGAEASSSDLTACEVTGLPWYIYSLPSDTMQRYEPSGYKAPLLGRTFVHGVHDCYSLVRDYYAQVLDIVLPDFDRDHEWWHKGQSLYLDNFTAAGFRQVPIDGIRLHDGLLMQVRSPTPNHGAVYIGDDVIMQHVHGRLSTRDVFGGYWLKHTTHVLRHESLL
jgi:proteasome lid subunit RPN8/RPN11